MTFSVTVDANPALRAVVIRCTPLFYTLGADPTQDRPAHVRAGSGLGRVAERLVVVQDDAAFLAVIDPETGAVEPVALPAGPDGVRQWDEVRGNKPLKPDLEACITADGRLIAFGSGSTPLRERVLVADGLGTAAPALRWVPCPELYAALRADTSFSGSEMNIEAAALVDGRVRLFNRGNGAPVGSLLPVNATCDLELRALLDYLDGRTRDSPAPGGIVTCRLGSLERCPLGFTDAAAVPGGVLFSAAAEASPDTYRDGPVAGSAIGYLGDRGAAWAPLETGGDTLFRGKVEGISIEPGRPDRLWAVLDHDAPDVPSELCEVELSGPWPHTGP